MPAQRRKTRQRPSQALKASTGEWVKVREGRWRFVETGATCQPGSLPKTASWFNKKERENLFQQTGQRFDSYDGFKRWCKATGFRELERGEPQDVMRREAEARDAAGLPPPEFIPDRRQVDRSYYGR